MDNLRELRMKSYSNVTGLFMLSPGERSLNFAESIQFSQFHPSGLLKQIDAEDRPNFYEKLKSLKIENEQVLPNALLHLVSSSDMQQHVFVGLNVESNKEITNNVFPELTIHPYSPKKFRLNNPDGGTIYLQDGQVKMASQIIVVRGSRDKTLKEKISDKIRNVEYNPNSEGCPAFMMIGGHPEGNFNHAIISGYVL